MKVNFYNSGPEMVRILLIHERWLEANGYKQQATSCRAQAASLTRKIYSSIGYYEKGKISYVNKRRKKNNYIIKQA
jgi:hypothetical protein